MSTKERALLDVILRNDLAAFTQRCFQTVVPGQPYLPNWHIDAMTHHLELCRLGEIRRLLISVPPRNLKSICASVAFPAFALGHDPSLRIVCVSYAQDLTVKHARDCRAVMQSAWYRRLFPDTRIDPKKNTEGEIETTARGYRLSTSVEGTLTGRGGNLIILDDPMKPAEAMSETRRRAVSQWYDGTLSSRLDSKTRDVIVIVMQRLHVDDLVGHVLEKGESWTHLELPAIADVPQEIAIGEGRIYQRAAGELLHPAREPNEVLDDLKAAMGSQVFSAQYQQAPVPPGGALIKWAWFKTYERAPDWRSGDRIVQSWDTASKVSSTNDFSVCTTWLIRGKDYYLLDVLRCRLEYTDLRRQILAHADVHKASTVLIEDAGSGTPLLQDLQREGKLRPIAMRPEGDKRMRIMAQTPVIEAGYVYLPAAAPWLGDFEIEIKAFPGGRHDDQVDSLSQFLVWASKHQESVDLMELMGKVAKTNLQLRRPSRRI
jgi:predicted phage terminase large subunit-like protein